MFRTTIIAGLLATAVAAQTPPAASALYEMTGGSPATMTVTEPCTEASALAEFAAQSTTTETVINCPPEVTNCPGRVSSAAVPPPPPSCPAGCVPNPAFVANPAAAPAPTTPAAPGAPQCPAGCIPAPPPAVPVLTTGVVEAVSVPCPTCMTKPTPVTPVCPGGCNTLVSTAAAIMNATTSATTTAPVVPGEGAVSHVGLMTMLAVAFAATACLL